MKKLMMIPLGLLMAGCVSVPPQVAQTHQKELEIIQELQKTHLALVDAYVDQKRAEFETFYFQEYGPAYYKNWMEAFKESTGRAFDPTKDFPLLYNDLVAEYLDVSAPIEKIRSELRAAIEAEYGNALTAHEAVGEWMENLKTLTDAQRAAVDSVLSGAHEGLSLDKVDAVVKSTKEAALKKMDSFSAE